MDELLALIAELVGESFDDAARDRVAKAAAKVLDTGADEARLEAKRLEAEVRKAQKRADAAEAKLADAAGNTDAKVAELRLEVDKARAQVADLEAAAVRREVRDRFARALGAAELPEAARDAAIKLADLDAVELDEKAEGGLAGATSAIDRLRADYGFLWDAGGAGADEGKAKGGGPRSGATPQPKPPKGGGEGWDPQKAGASAVADALRARGRAVRGAYGQSSNHGAAGAAGV